MSIEKEFFHLRPASEQSPVAGIEQLSEFLQSRLSELGYMVDPIQEDWGFWIAVKTQNAKMAIGVYGVGEDTSDLQFAVTVFTDKVRKWIIWPLLARSIEAALKTLQHDLSNLLDQTTSLVIVDRTTDYPL